MITWFRRRPDPAQEIANLRAQLGDFGRQIADARQHTADLLAAERADAAREREALIARYDAEQAQRRELVARLEGHVGMLTRNLEETTRQQVEQFGALSAAREQIADLTGERVLLREQIAALRAQVEQQATQIAELLEERTQARNQAQQYRSMYEFVERESRERAAKIAELEAEIGRLKSRIAELEQAAAGAAQRTPDPVTYGGSHV